MSSLLQFVDRKIELPYYVYVDKPTGFDASALFNIPIAADSPVAFNFFPDPALEPIAPVDQPGSRYRVEIGQVWRLGEHLVVCGDCTSEDAVDNLLLVARTGRSYKPNAGIFTGIFTHPPNHKKHPDYLPWFRKLQSLAGEMLARDGSLFVTIKGDSQSGQRDVYIEELVVAMCREWGWVRVDTLAWVRRGFPGEFLNRFKDSYQPVYHFAKSPYLKFDPSHVDIPYKQLKDAEPYHESSVRKRRGSRVSKPVVASFTKRALPSNVLEYYGSPGDFPPSDLAAFFLRAYSNESDYWLDPFCGEGSTIIAGQRFNRIVYGIDIDPIKIATTLERWSTLTSKEPELVKSSV